MAWMLQGLEAAFCHHLTILSADSEVFSVIANEHDGLIVRKDVEGEQAFQEALNGAIEEARERSGFTGAEFVEKKFADEEDVKEIYGVEEEDGTPETDHDNPRPPSQPPTRQQDRAPTDPRSAEDQDEDPIVTRVVERKKKTQNSVRP